MPALTMSHRPKNGAKKPRFELPALDLNFGNITDGTNIPPPLPSPKVPTPPQTPPAIDAKDAQAHGTAAANKANGISTGTYHPNEPAPLSPTPFVQQGTLRRMLSKRTMSNTAAESRLPGSQSALLLDNVDRPQSRGGFSLMGDRKSKRNSGWFKRFRNGDQPPSSRRSSFLFSGSSSNLPDTSKPLEPPPPMIPELRELEKDEGSLGSDIFRNIK
ncbi:hypothetical protein ISF_01197 [Cordyceps fumosorosea ARSEF 2679]|uniref:Uncharacterized protein n=1 Tax=Cordyceps fumosorosea (strain ARSEF 2679) TaxID=1081104 RepID=A0A162LKZ1_CORFA|nr:hypothetical protein ISF_01197 [Cordyceps fumosorosea ARSEF 2679]OAA72124.1 hypothetical protein ISF_01197 [Cordyceps fumosorosea ARSEF 2679]